MVSKNNKKLISIVLSVYNEEMNLRHFYKELCSSIYPLDGYYFELIFVNDGSVDNSLPILIELQKNDSNIKIVNLNRNYGHEVAMTAGMDLAFGDCVVFMDSDCQHPPKLLPEMFRKWEDSYDMVQTERIANKDYGFFKTFTGKLFYKIINMMIDFEIPSQCPDFFLISKKYVEILKKLREGNRMFRGLVSWISVPNKIVLQFTAQQRFSGKSNYSFLKSYKLAIDSLIAFSIRPLRMITFIGIIAGFISMILGLIFVIEIWTNPDYVYSGFGTTIFIITFIGSIQLIVLSIIGEYIGRIHQETRNRPLYIAEYYVNDENNL